MHAWVRPGSWWGRSPAAHTESSKHGQEEPLSIAGCGPKKTRNTRKRNLPFPPPKKNKLRLGSPCTGCRRGAGPRHPPGPEGARGPITALPPPLSRDPGSPSPPHPTWSKVKALLADKCRPGRRPGAQIAVTNSAQNGGTLSSSQLPEASGSAHRAHCACATRFARSALPRSGRGFVTLGAGLVALPGRGFVGPPAVHTAPLATPGLNSGAVAEMSLWSC